MHCRFYISGLSCYCLKILIILRHSLLRCIILVCYYFYFFLSDLFVRGENFIFIWNMRVPFPLFWGKTRPKKKFLLFFLYCDMLLCKRFRQKFTIYFIMISDKKNCDMYCTILVNIFCIEVWKIGTESSLFFYILWYICYVNVFGGNLQIIVL